MKDAAYSVAICKYIHTSVVNCNTKLLNVSIDHMYYSIYHFDTLDQRKKRADKSCIAHLSVRYKNIAQLSMQYKNIAHLFSLIHSTVS